MKYEKSCGAIVISDGKILVVEQNSGFYGLPKGHVENDETEIETALREVKEETNIDIKIDEKYRYQLTYNPKKNVVKDVVYYLATPLNYEIKNQEGEIKKVIWVEFDKINDVLSFENIKEVCYRALQDANLI